MTRDKMTTQRLKTLTAKQAMEAYDSLESEIAELYRVIDIMKTETNAANLPSHWHGVQFFDLDAENPLQGSCLVTSEAMCQTKLEKSAFRAACEVQEVVCMGKTVCKPVLKPSTR